MTLAGSEASYADEKGAEDEYVPRKEYEKLKREVEVLRARMQSLLKKDAPAEQGLKPAGAPVPQAKTKPPETHHPKVSPQAEVRPSADEGPQAKEKLGVAEGNRQKEAEESRRALDQFLRRQKVLFKRGELELEFTLAYAQDSTENVCFDADFGDSFCPEGSVVAPKFITRSVDASLIARYGLADDLELNLAVPYGYIEQEQDFRPFRVPTAVRRTDSVGIGDISWALRYTAWHESGNIPNLTLNLNAKSQTGNENEGLGSGFWNVGGGITLLKTIDPVVFFGSLGYTAVLEEEGIDPGDQIPYSFGTGFSMNDRVSFSTLLSGAVLMRTEFDGRDIAGSSANINTLQLSSTIQLSKGLFVEPFMGFGLNEEAGDFVVGFRVPYRFERRFALPFLPD